MGKRGARPGGLKNEEPLPEVERASDIIARAVASGPEHLLRDLESFRQEFLAERESGRPSTYWAFMALASCAALGLEELGRALQANDKPPLTDPTVQTPRQSLKIPLWAAIALYKSWMKAVVGDVRGDAARADAPLTLADAFGLAGDGGSRTVGKRHLLHHRDRNLALEVEMLLAQVPSMKESPAYKAVARTNGLSDKTVERAHKQWRDLARARLAGTTQSGS